MQLFISSPSPLADLQPAPSRHLTFEEAALTFLKAEKELAAISFIQSKFLETFQGTWCKRIFCVRGDLQINPMNGWERRGDDQIIVTALSKIVEKQGKASFLELGAGVTYPYPCHIESTEFVGAPWLMRVLARAFPEAEIVCTDNINANQEAMCVLRAGDGSILTFGMPLSLKAEDPCFPELIAEDRKLVSRSTTIDEFAGQWPPSRTFENNIAKHNLLNILRRAAVRDPKDVTIFVRPIIDKQLEKHWFGIEWIDEIDYTHFGEASSSFQSSKQSILVGRNFDLIAARYQFPRNREEIKRGLLQTLPTLLKSDGHAVLNFDEDARPALIGQEDGTFEERVALLKRLRKEG